MTVHSRALGISLVSLTLLGGMGAPPIDTRTVRPQEIEGSVRRVLERLPYYGVFDFIVFGVDRGTVTLVGYTYQERLKADAEMAARRAEGVDDVVNKIEVLPASLNDDRIRWATFFRIYTDDFLSRYAPGGVPHVLDELRNFRRFPGMQPIGVYPIHIIVRNGRTMLLGVVDGDADRLVAEIRAREVAGVFDVDNSLAVVKEPRR